MDFVVRVHGPIDQAMTLFQLRRLGANGEFHTAPKGGDDMQITGDVPDEKVDALIDALAVLKGAIHIGDRHISLADGTPKDCASIEEAEAHLGGPFTVPGTTRETWSFAGDVADHAVQVLYADEEHLSLPVLRERMDVGIDLVMPALKQLITDGTVRKFRQDETESYGLARAVRDKLDTALGQVIEE